MHDDLHVFIRCVNRPETNVFSTLALLACRDPSGFAQIAGIHLVSGDGRKTFLAPFDRTHGLIVHFALPETYTKIVAWRPKRRGAWSYMYALQLALATGGDALLLEDDIEPANGWHTKLCERVRAAESDGIRKFAMSGYYGYPDCPFAKLSNNYAQSSKLFWGNLMTYWPKHMLRGAAECFASNVHAHEELSTDLTVQAHLKQIGGRLLYTNPSIVQHRGDSTTLRNDGVRRSPIYDDGYRE